MTTQHKRVVITGMGVISPNGIGCDTFWDNCYHGRSGVARIDSFDTTHFESKIAGIVQDFDPEHFDLSHQQKNSLDRYALFALAAAEMAMKEAGLSKSNLDEQSLGVCIATAIAGTKYMEEEFLRLTENGYQDINPEWASRNLFTGASFNVASSEVAKHYGARGPVQTLATGCTAGLDAIGQALEIIRAGQADIMLAGAAEAPLTPIAMAAFDIIGALASDSNDAPEKASRPYDQTRSGFVLGESCGVLVMESLDHALARGANILAEVKGFGSTCNAYHMTDLAPEGLDLHRAMKLALTDGGVDPSQIDHVNAHGSSTPQNDVNESNAVKATLGDHAYNIPVCSLKSLIGHALAAANVVETIAAVLSIVHQKVPPTINHHVPDPRCDLDYVPNKGREAKIDYVLKDASGFSGIHSALVLARPQDMSGRASS